ncbi:MAG: histidinol-phosphate transaminase [Lachnospiraceae bacterium]|nr:histidinol-phosphate transaminase [Lachnospiraceae bacterium]
MSSFFSEKYKALTPYTPGEQPQERKYNKLNTNESPFPPSPYAQRLARQAAGDLQLYSDPEVRGLVEIACEKFGLEKEEILFTNGSDEILNFAFMAFCDENHPAAFADVTYGFYTVFAQVNNVPYVQIPLKDDFSIDVNDYIGIHKTIFIANPNAPTGIALSKEDIVKIVESNPNNVVVIDEAYVDFGGESCLDLIHSYKNLLVTQTFSKSRSMAGARLGFGAACKELIADLNTIKYSTNPYNINRMTMAAGIGALGDEEYFKNNCQAIIENRKYTEEELKKLGFEMTDSKTNFVFAKTAKMGGQDLYLALKERGILVRHFETERLKDYNRITIGSMEQMQELIDVLKELLK